MMPENPTRLFSISTATCCSLLSGVTHFNSVQACVDFFRACVRVEMCQTLAQRSDAVGAAYKKCVDELVKIKLAGHTYNLANTKHILTMAAERHASTESRAASRALLSTSTSVASGASTPSAGSSAPSAAASTPTSPRSGSQHDDQEDEMQTCVRKALTSMGYRGRGRGGSARTTAEVPMAEPLGSTYTKFNLV